MVFKNENKIATIAIMFAVAGLTMGNQKCEQKPEARELKKNVRIIKMEASTFMDGPSFNFSEVAQSQLSGVLFETKRFYERNIYPTAHELAAQDNTGTIQKVTVQSKTIAQLKSWFPEMKSSELQSGFSQSSECLVTRPQHLIYGKINALEAYSGSSFQFGFKPGTTQLPLSANFQMDKMRMDLSFQAFDPWTQQNVGSINTEAFKKDYKAGFGIDLGIIHIGPEFYRVTGMSEVTLQGLKNGVSSLADFLKSAPRQDWKSRVLIPRDNYVVIVGGAELGIQKGDRFKIVNEVHDWIGSPCGDGSIIGGSVAVTHDPWIVEVEEAGDLITRAKVLNPREGERMNAGALVTIDKLFEPPKDTANNNNSNVNPDQKPK